MVKNRTRAFSLYDIEEFVKEAGAEKINQRAIISLDQELESTIKELVDEARAYANYAGRTKLITGSDVRLASGATGSDHKMRINRILAKKRVIQRRRTNSVKLEGVIFSKRL